MWFIHHYGLAVQFLGCSPPRFTALQLPRLSRANNQFPPGGTSTHVGTGFTGARTGVIHFASPEAFLLNPSSLHGASGVNLTRFRNSGEFVAQCVAIILISVFLSKPYFASERLRLSMVVVLDSSASMWAYAERAQRETKQIAECIAATARHLVDVRFTLIATEREPKTFVRQGDLTELTEVLARWQPSERGTTSESAFLLAESLADTPEHILSVTDTAPRSDILPTPGGWLGVGEPLENVGIASVYCINNRWEAVITNYSDQPSDRTLKPSFSSEFTDPLTPPPPDVNVPTILRLEPNSSTIISGEFPPGTGWGRLTLSPDHFSIDDTADFILPLQRPLQAGVFPH